ncbi:putative DCC family thiol-disulfide oxidoreductase YuxK [Catenulispora sp. MAP12-49]|uniref:thiol-disulfide oxidoreductase DCC family protein n=1 Tax=Catenulispora sp. MAP12-49 TaxID=3156302 RepID=UPI003515D5D5
MTDGQPVVIYDGECGFCRAVIRHLAAKFAMEGTLLPWQSVDLAVYDLSEEGVRARMWFVADGHRYGGARAFAAWAGTGNRRARVCSRVLRTPGVVNLAEVVYRVVAKNRHRIPGPWERSCTI